MSKGTEEVKVLTSGYVYHGHTYRKGETIDMDKHDISPAVDRGQIRPKTKKGPGSTRATGPSQNR